MAYVADELGQQEACQFVSLPDEKLLIAKRQHWVSVAAPIGVTVLLGLIFAALSFTTLFLGRGGSLLLISLLLFIAAYSLSIIIKTIVDWYYHFYIVTTRKILEVSYTPFSHTVEDVFLDQVRITQIDVESQSLWAQVFDIGTITLYFDRPSHDKSFVLFDIQNPRHTGSFLSDSLEAIMIHQPIWFKERKKGGEKHHPYDFTDDYEVSRKRALKVT